MTLSNDNPCKACGARRDDRCICRRHAKAVHCRKNCECILLDGHSRAECFTHVDEAELRAFHGKEWLPFMTDKAAWIELTTGNWGR